jgi:hypothetical protein
MMSSDDLEVAYTALSEAWVVSARSNPVCCSRR